MSKWGIEEKETLDVIDRIEFCGDILNVACGDERFNNKLLEVAEKVIAVDLDEDELKNLEKNCPPEFKNKLQTKKIDIRNKFVFDDETFDGVFCTGTLHLFESKIIIKILKEMKRVLKKNGKIVFDFATDIKRVDKNGKSVVFKDEGNYRLEESIEFFEKQLKDFDFHIDTSTFLEEDLDSQAGYQYIRGNFLIISGMKKQ